MDTFIEWLQTELNQRNWTQADLARRSKVTQTHISRIMNGMRHPGPQAVTNIARALHVPQEEAFQRAGLLAPQSATLDDQRELDDLLKTIAGLTGDNQRLVFELVERIKLSEQR